MPLDEYFRKRDFNKTPEPRGREHKGRAGRSFVIQKHAATRLHYDFRLEMDGVLKSWAVPKGPSYDPAEKRLAMQTEDHPLEYGDFEGIIPKGEYGGGPVSLWDRGTWEPIENPHAGLAKGNLKFRLQGEKLQGAWALIRIKSRDPRDRDKSWLLIKERDEFVRPHAQYDVTVERPESVASGRSLEEIEAAGDRVWHSNRVEEKKGGKWRPKVPGGAAPRTGTGTGTRTGIDVKSIPGARAAGLAKFVAPQLATLVDDPPEGDDWVHELKFDGYRILCRIDGGKVRLLTRNEKDWTEAFAPIAEAAARLPCTRALIDGEAAVVLPDGTTSFNALQNAMEEGSRERLAYFAFDLLYLDGYDLCGVALEERKAALADLLRRAGPVVEPMRYSDHVIGTGRQFFEQACRMKLEGIISKRRGEPYRTGRGRSWVKVKCVAEQEFVIGGFTDPEGQRAGIGALLLGVHENGGLRFAGKVGTGFTERSARDLRAKLDALEVPQPPFLSKPTGLRLKGAHWVKPELVAEVKFSEWTPDGKLRHPSFQGLREDKKAGEIVRETPSEEPEPAAPGRKKAAPRKKAAARKASSGRAAAVKKPRRTAVLPAAQVERPVRSAGERGAWDRIRAAKAARGEPARDRGGPSETVAGVRITHPERVLYPDLGVTKLGLARFYESIAGEVLPHLAGRPTTLVRCPEGVSEPCFYQKHTGYWAPSALRRIKIKEKTKVGEYLVVDDLPGLIGLVQMGILEIHTWNSTADHLEEPDRLVFDLDPAEDVPWPRVVEGARLLREELSALKLKSFVKTTGGKGLHVVVPIARGPSWDEGLEFSRRLAEKIAAERPREYIAEMSKARRVGRIYIDYLRNLRGSTSIAACSTRAKPGAPVSTPLHWDELDGRMRPERFTVRTLPERLASLREDPWKGYDRLKQRLPAGPV